MLLMKYFEQQESYGDKWLLKDEIKKLVKFEQLNLLDDYDRLGKFDVIFCRNVLIYFEPEIKSIILDKLADCLKPKGILILGSAETITGLTNKLTGFGDHRGIYTLA